MARYSKIYNSMWSDPDFENLSNEGKLLYVYLLTCPIGSSAGYFRLPVKQVAIDLDLTKAEALKLLTEDNSLWEYDESTNQVFIRNYLKYNKLGGAKQMANLNLQIKGLADSPLHLDFIKAARQFVGEEIIEYLDQHFLSYAKDTALLTNDTYLLDYLKYI